MKHLREGVTTGSCAAAASAAAAKWRVSGICPEYVFIDTPSGKRVGFEIIRLEEMRCGVIKDAGDDPDVTDGCMIIADVEIMEHDGDIFFRAGEGVGIVTHKGLKIPVGEPAINPVPRKMISGELRKIIGLKSAYVTISVPDGEKIAEHTFNPRLGIKNGISILGTTGIVRPMSEESVRESLYAELEMYHNQGFKSVAMTPGNEGEKFLRNLVSDGGCIVHCSNYIGFMLDSAEYMGFENILLCGQTGKLVKLAGDIMNTHSHIADGRNEIICTHAALSGASSDILHELYKCCTTEESAKILKCNNMEYVWQNIAEKAAEKCMARVHGKIMTAIIYTDRHGNILAKTENTDEVIRRWCMNE